MAWMDDLNSLHDWLMNAASKRRRFVRARVMALTATGLGYYYEGELDLKNDSIKGQVTRFETNDKWDPYPNNWLNPPYPFDPNATEAVPMSINLSTGAVLVDTKTYAQPVSISGYFLAIDTTVTGQGGIKVQMTLSLQSAEEGILQ